MSLNFTDENFEQDVLNEEQVVLVDFYADWCGPCKMMGPVVDQVAEELTGVAKVGKLNVDNNPNTARKYGVMTIPTFLIIKNGEVKEKVVGTIDKNLLVEKIKAAQ